MARINGIKENIIEDAKNRLSDNKVKLDKILNQLQKEKNYLERLIKEHEEAQRLADEARSFFLSRKEKLDERLKSQNNLLETQNKQLIAGKKMLSFIQKFNVKSRKKDANNGLMEEVKTFLKLEKSKTEIKVLEQQNKANEAGKQPNSSSKNTQKVIKASGKTKVEDELQQDKIVVGSLVQLLSSRKNGTVESIKGDVLTVLFDSIRLKVTRDKLRFLK